ncbi:MAG: transglutaminase family protein [Isosphaeraceae bacterium]
MLLRIRHATTLTYSEPVSETVFEARMAPLSDDDQTTLGYRLQIEPPAPVTAYRDGFGNRVELFNIGTPYQALSIEASSYVRTHRRPGEARLRAAGWEPGREIPVEAIDYLRPSPLIDQSPALDDFVAGLPRVETSLADQVLALRDAVQDRLTYRKAVTDASTRVSQVLALGCGVCQDFTHLFLAAARGIGLPARYVSGYIHEPGEVETHAWCQVWAGPVGWVDVDPTHGLFVGDDHVAIAVGRDYQDVTPNRGVWKGRAQETIRVKVAIEPVERVPYEMQGWADPQGWSEPAAAFTTAQAPRGSATAFPYQRQGGPNGLGKRSAYRGQYRHQQGQQQQ